MSERIYNHSPDCDCLDPFIIKPCNCHYQELTTLRARVRDLEAANEDYCAKIMTLEEGCEIQADKMEARIRELEEVMPLPEMFRQLNIAYIELGFPTQGKSFLKLADRIEKVMTKQPEEKNE